MREGKIHLVHDEYIACNVLISTGRWPLTTSRPVKVSCGRCISTKAWREAVKKAGRGATALIRKRRSQGYRIAA